MEINTSSNLPAGINCLFWCSGDILTVKNLAALCVQPRHMRRNVIILDSVSLPLNRRESICVWFNNDRLVSGCGWMGFVQKEKRMDQGTHIVCPWNADSIFFHITLAKEDDRRRQGNRSIRFVLHFWQRLQWLQADETENDCPSGLTYRVWCYRVYGRTAHQEADKIGRIICWDDEDNRQIIFFIILDVNHVTITELYHNRW